MPYCHETLTDGCPICERCRVDAVFAAAIAQVPPLGVKPERSPIVATKQSPSKQQKKRREQLRLPCVHEGAVVEWCHTCAGERGHVRDCSHPDNPAERCTRGDRSKTVWCCLDCTRYEQEPPPSSTDTPYEPSDPAIVERMLDLAGVGPGDTLYDLGSGDGRILIAAAKRGARAVGIEKDPSRVKLARANALVAGVGVEVIEADMHAVDFSAATVVTLYLWPNDVRAVSWKLRSLSAGTRIISQQEEIVGWRGKKVDRFYYYIIGQSISTIYPSPVAIDVPIKLLDVQPFNCSLVRYEQGWLLAYRSGWGAAKIVIADAHNDGTVWRVTNPKVLTAADLTCPAAKDDTLEAVEDPRLFYHQNDLYLAFVAVLKTKGRHYPRQWFAKLDTNHQVTKVWEPEYPNRQPAEKNWQPFSYDGQLYAIYSMRPWRVLHLKDDGTADWVRDAQGGTDHPGIPYDFGHPRGGAPPVRHGNEYYCFFHGADHSRRPGVYVLGLCTFSVTPPFRPIRYCRFPLAYPSQRERRGWPAVTYYACGAVLQPDPERWIISYGDNDWACRVSEIPAREIEDRLEYLDWVSQPHYNPPEGWRWPDGGKGYEVGQWRWIVGRDEYGLRELDLRGQIVLDIGGYAGTTAWLASVRGAQRVDSYEPNPRAAVCLAANTAGSVVRVFGKAVLGAKSERTANRERRAVVVETEELTSVVARPAAWDAPDEETVPVVGIDDAIQYALADATNFFVGQAPRVRLLKLDCEGAEEAILLESKLLHKVDHIRGEYHRLSQPRITALRRHLVRSGFCVEFGPPDPHGTGWFKADNIGGKEHHQRPAAILFAGTLADVVSAEACLTDLQRNSAKTMYLALPPDELPCAAALFAAYPTWRGASIVDIDNPDALHTIADVERYIASPLYPNGQVYPAVEYADALRYRRSTFLTEEDDAADPHPAVVAIRELKAAQRWEGTLDDWRTALACKAFPPQVLRITGVPQPVLSHIAIRLAPYSEEHLGHLLSERPMPDDPDVAAVIHRTMLCETRLKNIKRWLRKAQAEGKGGATAECGVASGGGTMLLARLNPEYVCEAYDTFAGMPPVWDTEKGETYFTPDCFKPLSNTLELLRAIPNVAIRQGYFPESVPIHDQIERYALVHLDCDLYTSMLAALRWFWPRTAGYMVIDDYLRDECPGVALALQEWTPDWHSLIVDHDPDNCQVVLKGGMG